MKKLNLNININSLDEFYRECDNIEGGNPAEINNIEIAMILVLEDYL